MMIWNGIIRANTVAYIVYCMSFASEIKSFINQQIHDRNLVHFSISLALLMLMVATPMFTAVAIWRVRDHLHKT